MDVVVTVPADTALRARLASADCTVDIGLGSLDVTTAAGDLRVASVGGSVTVKTAGGDVRLGRVGGSLSVRSASGDVVVDTYAGEDVSCATVAGDVLIGIEPGRSFDLDLYSLAGDIDNEFAVSGGEDPEPGGDIEGSEPRGSGRIRVRSTAGDIALRRAVRH